MSSTLKGRLILLALVSLLAIPLAVMLSRTVGGLVHDLVALPFLYLAWIGRLYLRAVPRVLFWGALLLFGLALIVADVLIATSKRKRNERRYRHTDHAAVSQRGPVSRLAGLVHAAPRSAYLRGELARRLGELALQAADDREYRPRSDIDGALDELGAPPEVRAFLRQGQGPLLQFQRGGLIARLRQRFRAARARDGVCDDLERTVRYLEDRLEGL